MAALLRPKKWWQRELLLGGALLATGLVLLPVGVFWVGQQVFGDYAAEGGIGTLTLAIWAGLGQGNTLAWLLVLSPYAVIQLLRAAWWVLHRAPAAP